MGKVAIYARVSTLDKQDYTRQVSDCKTAIGGKYNENDIEVYGEQISGYRENEKRPQLVRMLEKIEQDVKYFDCIYVTEISRLGRDPKATRKLIDELTEKKIPIFITSINRRTLEENGERDTIMNIVLQVLMEFADSESRLLKRRSQSGLLQSAKDGKAMGSKNLPYGYKKAPDKKLIVDDEEAEVIREIFDLYKEGNGFKKIAGHLNKNKVPTRTNKAFGTQLMKFNRQKTADKIIWVDKTVNDILNNTIYKGERRHKGEKLIDGDTDYKGPIIKRGADLFKTIILDAPSIISGDLFDKCQEIMKSKTHRNSLKTYNYLLKDLLRCGICGRNIFAKYKPVTGGDKVYICSSRLERSGSCGNKGVNIFYLESVVYDMLIGTKVLLHLIDQSDKLLPSVKKEIENLTKQLSLEETELTKQNKRIEKWAMLFRDTDMSMEEYKVVAEQDKKALSLIKNRITLLSKSMREQNEILVKIGNKTKDADFLSKLTTNRPEIIAIFKQFIETIYITKTPVAGDVLIDIHLRIGNKRPGSTMMIMIDNYVMRFRNPQFTYQVALPKMLVTKYNDNGVLLNTESEIYSAFNWEKAKHKYVVPDENIMIL